MTTAQVGALDRWVPWGTRAAPGGVQTGTWGRKAGASRDAHPSGHAQGDVALLPGPQDLQFIVVAAGGERLAGLGQAHVRDAPSFPGVLQELRRRRETGRRVKGGGGRLGDVRRGGDHRGRRVTATATALPWLPHRVVTVTALCCHGYNAVPPQELAFLCWK